MPNLMTPREMATFLNVSVKTIYYWIGRNEIPYLRVGKHVRFNCEEVLNGLREKTEESKPACVQSWQALQMERASRSLKIRPARFADADERKQR